MSTATIALQRQLVDRDLPRLADSLADALPRRPEFALLKGRRNYLCLNKIHGGARRDADGRTSRPQEELFDPMAATALGRDVQRLTAWASTTDSGDRDDLKPGVAGPVLVAGQRVRAGMPWRGPLPVWRRVLLRTGPGPGRRADIVVTNHALLAIDAVAESAVLPEHSLLVVDEAHELVDRVTSVATAELSSAALGVASRRIARLVDPELTERLEASSATFASAIHDATAGPHRPSRRRDGDIPDRAARRGQRGTLGDRLHQRREGGRGARRSGRGAERDIRHRVANPDVVHARDTRSHRRGLAGSRGQPRFPARRAAGGAAVGRGSAAQPGVLAFDDGVDVRDADDRRDLRRDGRGVGPGRTGRRGKIRAGVASTSDRRSSTPRPESSTSPPICRRRAATAPARPSN